MSGHSKWANIKRKKGANDAAKANVFTKIGRELAVAVKQGGSDPATNSRLRDTIAKAKAANMPNDNITRSIKKASGELGNVNYEEITYEGYAAGGVAVIVETLTDNKNRTAGDVRHHFDKCGGAMGTIGCVSYMFDKKGVIIVEKGDMDEDTAMMTVLECGADDLVSDGDVYIIYTVPSDFSAVREALEKDGTFSILSAGIEMVPQNTVKPEAQYVDKIQKLLDMLDDNDDVQNVYHNAELDEDEE